MLRERIADVLLNILLQKFGVRFRDSDDRNRKAAIELPFPYLCERGDARC